jgi:hypothetical protein
LNLGAAKLDAIGVALGLKVVLTNKS